MLQTKEKKKGEGNDSVHNEDATLSQVINFTREKQHSLRTMRYYEKGVARR